MVRNVIDECTCRFPAIPATLKTRKDVVKSHSAEHSPVAGSRGAVRAAESVPQNLPSERSARRRNVIIDAYLYGHADSYVPWVPADLRGTCRYLFATKLYVAWGCPIQQGTVCNLAR